MKHPFPLLLFLIAVHATAQQPQTYATDTLIADFNYLIHQLEETHPDPYTNYGGRALFKRKVARVVWGLRQDSVTTADELHRRACAFLAPLQDGHTVLYAPKHSATVNRLAPIYFRPINDGIIVRTLPARYKHLLGSRLMAIENLTTNELCTALSERIAAENIIDRYRIAAWEANRSSTLQLIFRELPADSIRYTLLSPDGQTVRLTLPWLSEEEANRAETATQPDSDELPKRNLSYAFTDNSRRIMYFRSTSIMARDNIEAMRRTGVDYYSRMQHYYRSLQQTMPADTLEAIQGMPSFSEEFGKMLLQMKANRSKYLIIDLRGNGGGWTPITLPTLYQLWGDTYLKTNMNTKSYRRLSPLYMQKINTTLEAFNKRWNAHYAFGDYTFYEDRRRMTKEADRNAFIDHCMSSVKEQLREQNGQPVYTPEHVYVVTDAHTFSAAFHYAFYLWRMGATVVGVASCQAPNTYMEQTPLTLPATGLKGTISNTQQLFLPVDDERAQVFWPTQYGLTYDILKRYGFHRQAEVLYLIDSLNQTLPPSEP